MNAPLAPPSAERQGFRDPRVLLPFILITLIWGSTWIVIKDQLGPVPPPWSVSYRFIVATAAMFAVAAILRVPLGIGTRGHALALLFGVPQFFLNFNFVYAAEHHITSGLVAMVFALLMVPNSALAFLFLKHRATRGFILGSAIAIAGIALLFVQEMRSSSASRSEVLLGIGLTIAAVLAASCANTLQASERMRRRPIAAMLAWGMFYGTCANLAYALAVHGAPVFEARAGYWVGVVYLGLFASALAFFFYIGIIRAVGPGKAAYSSVIVPVIAMALSTIFEDYRWSTLAIAGGALALFGMVIALRARPSA